MRILVTGAEGLLGVALQKASLGMEDEYIFTGYDDFDITDSEAVDLMIKVNAFDVVVNCAAVTDHEIAENHPDIAFNVNATGVDSLARAICREGGLLIHPDCNLFNSPENLVISKTKHCGIDAVKRSGCDAVIIIPALKTAEEWPNEVVGIARLIVDIINNVKNQGRTHGIEIIELKAQGE